MNIKYIIGIIILLFSIILPIYKIEIITKSLVESKSNFQILLSEKDLAIDYSESKKRDIIATKLIVEKSKDRINELVQQSHELNEEIDNAFKDSLLNFEKADSIHMIYINKLSINENSIDSMNEHFNMQSDLLIIILNEYNQAEHGVNIFNYKSERIISEIAIDLFFIIVYLIIFIVGLKKSIILIKNNSSF